MITTGNEESAGRRVEFDSTWNDADRRGEKVTPALDRAITKFLDGSPIAALTAPTLARLGIWSDCLGVRRAAGCMPL
jgi:hypothetical protein